MASFASAPGTEGFTTLRRCCRLWMQSAVLRVLVSPVLSLCAYTPFLSSFVSQASCKGAALHGWLRTRWSALALRRPRLPLPCAKKWCDLCITPFFVVGCIGCMCSSNAGLFSGSFLALLASAELGCMQQQGSVVAGRTSSAVTARKHGLSHGLGFCPEQGPSLRGNDPG